MAYTSFFRDADVLDAIVDRVIPWTASLAEIKVWDAGCATGEEPYTLAILFAENLDPFTFRNLRILATDHEESDFPQFEDRISEGRYHRQDLVWVSRRHRDTYFQPTPTTDLFEVLPGLKQCIRFVKNDLLDLAPVDSGFALVVCKNVLMHLPLDRQSSVVDMFYRALRPGGFLALDGFQVLPDANLHQFERVVPGTQLFRRVEGA